MGCHSEVRAGAAASVPGVVRRSSYRTGPVHVVSGAALVKVLLFARVDRRLVGARTSSGRRALTGPDRRTSSPPITALSSARCTVSPSSRPTRARSRCKWPPSRHTITNRRFWGSSRRCVSTRTCSPVESMNSISERSTTTGPVSRSSSGSRASRSAGAVPRSISPRTSSTATSG